MAKFVLKPCPFCASDDIHWMWNVSRKYGYFAFVECNDCKARSKAFTMPEELFKPKDFDSLDNMDFWQSKPFQKATEAWNQRKRRRKAEDK